MPVGTIFTGVLLLHLFYWTTNQQITQRTLGARSLEEGQKGVLTTGFLKLLGPLYLVVPGMTAFAYFAGQEMHPDQSCGALVNAVPPPALAGQESIGAYLQKMNGMYFIPIVAVVLVGMLTSRVSAVAANTALVGGLIVIGCGYFVPPRAAVVDSMSEFHFLAAVFMYLVIYMLIVGSIRPMDQAFTTGRTGSRSDPLETS